jgi:hypothetical protein
MASNVHHESHMVKASAASGLVLVALLSATFVVVACSSSDNSEFPGDPPKPDAEPDAPGSFLPDGGGPDADAGAKSCTPTLPTPFTPAWTAPTQNSAACTAPELKMYWDSCLADAAKTEADGTCAKFKTDHPTCGACTEPDDKSGPIQWQAGRKFYTLNVAGCIELQQAGTDAGASGCGEAYNAAVQCSRESCISCITEANSFPLFSECQKKVGMQGICKSYETAQSTACQGYKNAGSPALACFPTTSSEAQEAFFTRVVAVTCGTP